MADIVDHRFADMADEFNRAWDDPRHTRFAFPPVDVNQVLAARYVVEPPVALTRAMVWDMEVKKSWDPARFIPYVVSEGRSWGRHALGDREEHFFRSSMQLGWITPERGKVLEEVFIDHANQRILFLGRDSFAGEHASHFQPLFHVEHAVGGSDSAPLNLWRIVLLTPQQDVRFHEPFKERIRQGLLPGFLEIYIESELGRKLTRKPA